jgi:N-acetylglucosaminyldiphosphoundecaprenol N-acetyl-beta-D-mannosaminyltransferase
MTTSIYLLNYPVYKLPVENILVTMPERTIINTLNTHSYITAKKDHLFYTALQNSDILLPDGEGIVIAARLLLKQKIKKIAGADIHIHLLTELNKKGGKVFYLGLSDTTLAKIKHRINLEFPIIELGTYSPPYKPVFTDEESQAMINAVNAFVPDILFVGMTAPKQEKWVFQYHKQLQAGIICSIGAVFDFYAGTVVRPHPILIKLKLEWFGRFLKEPRRMWRRVFISTPVFLWDVVKEKINHRGAEARR